MTYGDVYKYNNSYYIYIGTSFFDRYCTLNMAREDILFATWILKPMHFSLFIIIDTLNRDVEEYLSEVNINRLRVTVLRVNVKDDFIYQRNIKGFLKPYQLKLKFLYQKQYDNLFMESSERYDDEEEVKKDIAKYFSGLQKKYRNFVAFTKGSIIKDKNGNQYQYAGFPMDNWDENKTVALYDGTKVRNIQREVLNNFTLVKKKKVQVLPLYEDYEDFANG